MKMKMNQSLNAWTTLLMIAAIALLFVVVVLANASAVAQSVPSTAPRPGSEARYDLNGEWQGQFHTGEPTRLVIEKVMIQQIDDQIVATKITGNDWVPAGKVTLRGTYDANPFSAEQVCADRGYANPHWLRQTVTVVDSSHLIIRGEGCGGGTDAATWERPGKVTIALDNAVLFDLNQYQLKPEAAALLARVKVQLNQTHPNAHLLIAGYTDNTGTDSHNRQLSRKRAQSVAHWLETHGIPTELLEIEGFGSKNPRYPNTNEESRAHNRRVEIVVL